MGIIYRRTEFGQMVSIGEVRDGTVFWHDRSDGGFHLEEVGKIEDDGRIYRVDRSGGGYSLKLVGKFEGGEETKCKAAKMLLDSDF